MTLKVTYAEHQGHSYLCHGFGFISLYIPCIPGSWTFRTHNQLNNEPIHPQYFLDIMHLVGESHLLGLNKTNILSLYLIYYILLYSSQQRLLINQHVFYQILFTYNCGVLLYIYTSISISYVSYTKYLILCPLPSCRLTNCKKND